MAELWTDYGLPFVIITAQSLALLTTLLVNCGEIAKYEGFAGHSVNPFCCSV